MTDTEQRNDDEIEIAFEVEGDDELPPEPITMIELAALKRDREQLAELRADVSTIAGELHKREQRLIERIEAGATVDGKAVVMHRRRQSISWLTVVAKELGHDAIERIKNTWPTVFSKELQIG